jgi:outer membrane protein TolC
MVRISYDLKNAFAQMLYSQENTKLQDQIIKRRKENAGLVTLRFEAGMENKGNELLSNAFLAQAKYDKRQAERSIEVTRQQLSKVIGREDDSNVKIAGKIPIPDPSGIGDPFDIVKENPQYRVALAKERASQAAVTLAKSNFSPTFGLNASAAKQGNSWSMANNTTTWGFSVGVPIFNGANNIFTFKSSQADLAAAKANRQNIENDLMAKLKQYYADYVNAYEKLKVDKEFLEAATVRADIARNRYRNGLLTFDNWDIIENDLITKQQTYIASERNLYTAEAAWEQAAGRGVFE